MADVINFKPNTANQKPSADDDRLPEWLVGRPTPGGEGPSNPAADRWQVLADMAYAMDGGMPGGGDDLDYLDQALVAFPAEPMADFAGYAVHRLLHVLRDRCLRRILHRNEHGDC
jgi:hypothetical protein